MSNLLWFAIGLLSIMPAVTCLVYFRFRLRTRKEQLRQTLISMQLEVAYMTARHGDVAPDKRKVEFNAKFNGEFNAGLGITYVWPVALTTVLTFLGWFLTLSRVYSLSSISVAKEFLPTAAALGFAGAFAASLLTVFDDFNHFNLEPRTYYGITYRLLFSSTAACLLVMAIKLFPGGDKFDDKGGPLLAFGIGLFPVEKTWKVITDWAAKWTGTSGDVKETGIALETIP
jgi:hypothetical protein